MPIFYALVARGKTVLAEFTARSGNFPTVTRVLLGKIGDADAKMSYIYDEYVFHYQVENGITYLCLADEKQKRRVPFLFLEDVKERFTSMYRDRAKTAIAFAMNTEFARVLEERMVREERRCMAALAEARCCNLGSGGGVVRRSAAADPARRCAGGAAPHQPLRGHSVACGAGAGCADRGQHERTPPSRTCASWRRQPHGLHRTVHLVTQLISFADASSSILAAATKWRPKPANSVVAAGWQRTGGPRSSIRRPEMAQGSSRCLFPPCCWKIRCCRGAAVTRHS